jgi:type VI secretion system protein ImpK
LNGKIRFEGRADSEGLVPNDTPEHKAINRRVDLLIQ